MDDEGKGIRRTISLTHRQLGVSGALLTAMLLLNPVKQWFFTREEGAAQSKEIADLKHDQEEQFKELRVFIVQGQEDQMHKMERLNDKIIERIKDSEGRTTQSDAKQEKRIETLEQALLLNGSRFRKSN